MALACLAVLALARGLNAQHGGVASTLHNLSVSGPGEIRSLTETEVCKFCHIPHSAVVPQPLWGHALSRVPRYDVPQPAGRPVAFPQPDGSSRLCLSCHDGTVALGELAGKRSAIPMQGAQRLGPGRQGFLGTDLSGGHPVSIAISDSAREMGDAESDMVVRPLAAVRGGGSVRLDAQGKVQCTTCHDPHADRFFVPGKVPHFWVKPTVSEVCQACHGVR